MRRWYRERRWATTSGVAASHRQQKSEYYAWQASLSGGVSPQQERESLPHQLDVPWPYSWKEMGADFMKEWQEESKLRGFNIRLSAWHNSHWKESLEHCASTYRLSITGDADNPDRSGAVKMLFDFAKAAQAQPHKPATLPWEQIIQWWDGEDRTRSRR